MLGQMIAEPPSVCFSIVGLYMFSLLMNWLRFAFLATLKAVGSLVYPSKLYYLNQRRDWDNVSLILILNHTSLFEIVYSVTLPYRYLWQFSRRMIIPVATSTLKHPMAAWIFKALSPKMIPLTRKRDGSWQQFLDAVDEEDICVFLPEGRMRRSTGLDKHGKPMTVKTGVYDLLQKFRGRQMAFAYSHGLGHIWPPGSWYPRIFKRVECTVEILDVDEYLGRFEKEANPAYCVRRDMERRRDRHCQEIGACGDPLLARKSQSAPV